MRFPAVKPFATYMSPVPNPIVRASFSHQPEPHQHPSHRWEEGRGKLDQTFPPEMLDAGTAVTQEQ